MGATAFVGHMSREAAASTFHLYSCLFATALRCSPEKREDEKWTRTHSRDIMPSTAAAPTLHLDTRVSRPL